MTVFVGIDNGTTGSVGIVDTKTGEHRIDKVPAKQEFSYTKKKQMVTRIDTPVLNSLLCLYRENIQIVGIERPMINSMRFKASISGARALEAVLIVVEALRIPYRYIDSKEWQRALLPHGLETSELKKASLEIARRLYPMIDFKGFKDADGLLIAHYLKQKV